ncbi:MAG: aminotransferase class V-fold PLP-dependent enzyme, partial [Planctomycetales bacterium]|nr:aminotransferase class V-fold PLP-dependent enzyme [Planctomycetales bacterium]
NLKTVSIPLPLREPEDIVTALVNHCSPATRLLVVSHITSPTAIVFPIAEICEAFKALNVPVCVDGPHAILQERFKLHTLGCDFYTASCHKWLCAPLGSGFVYAAPQWHDSFQPARLSWGRIQPATPEHWSDELLWTGTRDYSAFLSIPYALEFFEQFDLDRLEIRNHALARYARTRLLEIPG